MTASLLVRAGEKLLVKARAPYLQAIRLWKTSDCQSPDPSRHPNRVHDAVRWRGPGQPCQVPEHAAWGCTRCHSCATCRPEQRAPFTPDIDVWMLLGGRGAGKTKPGAKWTAEQLSTRRRVRGAILAATFADARDTCIEGETGLISVFDEWGWREGPRADYTWNRSLGELIVAETRSRVKLFSAQEPGRLRGPQHHFAWVDELAQVAKRAPDAWDMLQLGLRLGEHPLCACSTTPLPLQVLRDLIADPRCAVSRGTTFDNEANLAPSAVRTYRKKYEGTRLGRQELAGEMLEDMPGALWTRDMLEGPRIRGLPTCRWSEDPAAVTHRTAREIVAGLAERGVTLVKIVVGVDPAVTSGDKADESGIVVAGRGDNGRVYVLADYTIRASPGTVCDLIIQAYDDWDANEVLLETNNGGEWLPDLLAARVQLLDHTAIPAKMITAKKGKRVRAEPASALTEQGQVIMVGTHPHLEDQLCVWTPEEVASPDRMDAFVYDVLHLDGGTGGRVMSTRQAPIPRHQPAMRGGPLAALPLNVGPRRSR